MGTYGLGFSEQVVAAPPPQRSPAGQALALLALVCRSLTSSTPSMRPRPRTSPITECLSMSRLWGRGGGRGQGRHEGHFRLRRCTRCPAGQQAQQPARPGSSRAAPETSPHSPQVAQQVPPNLHTVGLQPLLVNHPQHRPPRRHRHRVAACGTGRGRGRRRRNASSAAPRTSAQPPARPAHRGGLNATATSGPRTKGVEVQALRHDGRDLGGGDHRRKRQPVADALGHGDNVGDHALGGVRVGGCEGGWGRRVWREGWFTLEQDEGQRVTLCCAARRGAQHHNPSPPPTLTPTWFWKPQYAEPVRPNPVCTSSAMHSPPASRTI